MGLLPLLTFKPAEHEKVEAGSVLRKAVTLSSLLVATAPRDTEHLLGVENSKGAASLGTQGVEPLALCTHHCPSLASSCCLYRGDRTPSHVPQSGCGAPPHHFCILLCASCPTITQPGCVVTTETVTWHGNNPKQRGEGVRPHQLFINKKTQGCMWPWTPGQHS